MTTPITVYNPNTYHYKYNLPYAKQYFVQVREYEVNKWSSLEHEQSPDKTGRVYPHLA